MSFALRAKAANDRGTPISESLETYFQASYSAGFLSISQDLAALTRSLLVASTLGGEMLTLHKLTPRSRKRGVFSRVKSRSLLPLAGTPI